MKGRHSHEHSARDGGRHAGRGGRGWHHHGHDGEHRVGRLRLGRMLSAADLHLILLALIEQRPRHGYDLIKAVQDAAGGAYVPSPGMVYPALSYLEESGQVASQADGAKRQYTLAESGLATLTQDRARVTALFEVLKGAGERLGKARAADERVAADLAAADQAPAMRLEAARRDLKAVLFDSLDASAEEQQRVADILQRTIVEIRKR